MRIALLLATMVTACWLNGCGNAKGTTVPPPAPPPPAVQPLAITSSTPPNGGVQSAYAFTFSAGGGVTPYDWSWVAAAGSSLPPGLSISAGGSLSGSPSTAGTYNVVVTVADSGSPAAHISANYSIIIDADSQLVISNPPPNGTVGQTYGGTFQVLKDHCLATFSGWQPEVSGGKGGYSWHLSAAPGSSVPPGLGVGVESYTCGGSTRCCVTVNSPSLFHGAPNAAGTYDVIVTVSDSATPPNQASVNYTIQIAASAEAADMAKEFSNPPAHARYKLVDLGTFGGPQSYENIPNNYAVVLNDQGIVTGWADTSTPDPFPAFCFNEEQPCYVSQAFQWQNGKITDLNALPGGGSSASTWISPNGLIAGFSENGEIDPSLPGAPEVRAVLWKDQEMIDLGTFSSGGYESVANAVNSRGQVAGGATNTTLDNYSLYGGTETHAFLWQNGVMKDLGTLGGSDSVALLINEAGQIVGESFLNDTPSPYCAAGLDLPLSSGAFLWEGGRMTNLGSFGGTCTFASDLNNRGEVVGLSTLPGDQYQHAFLWRHGVIGELPNTLGGNNSAALVITNEEDVVGWASLPGDLDLHATLWKNGEATDLGTVGGDTCSAAYTLNSVGQISGVSAPNCDFSQSRAFLWEDGAIFDLNTLIPPNSTLYLTTPATINDQGEIAGTGLDSNGNQHAFVLIPCDQNHPDVAGCDYIPFTGTENAEISSLAKATAARPPVAQKTLSGSAVVPPFFHKTNPSRRLGIVLPK